MKGLLMTITPQYYNNFSCIMGECKHTCCAGWEIDIDEKTLNKYKSLHSELGNKIRNNIFTDDDGAHFKMCKDGKCPMLTRNGLCEIILKLGEEWICGICQMHPRFVNNFEHHTEMGVGLCCQAACKLILTSEFILSMQSDENMGLDDVFGLYSAEQNEIFRLRNHILALLEDDSAITARYNVLKAVDIELEFQDIGKLTQILNCAEVLDPSWRELLDIVKSRKVDESVLLDGNIAVLWKRLVAYFIFRYVSQASNLFEVEEYVLFSIISADFICCMGYVLKDRYQGGIFESICEAARMYSCEIEYSSDNIEIIIDGIYSIE